MTLDQDEAIARSCGCSIADIDPADYETESGDCNWWDFTPEELAARYDQLSDDEIAEIERERRAQYAVDQADMRIMEDF